MCKPFSRRLTPDRALAALSAPFTRILAVPPRSIAHFAAGLLLLTVVVPSARAFDHTYANWLTVLNQFVEQGRVRYSELKTQPQLLEQFVAECGRVEYAEYERWSRQERLAFVLNLYNAAVIKLLIDRWPLESVKDLGFFTSAWNIEFIPLFGHTISLGNLQHDVLRPGFKDTRTHFALCSSAASGPALRGEPYLPERVDAQLDEQVREFMTQRPTCNRFEQGTLYLSPIFDWYEMDFGKRTGIITFARIYFPEASTESRLEFTPFDWSLNGK